MLDAWIIDKLKREEEERRKQEREREQRLPLPTPPQRPPEDRPGPDRIEIRF